MILRVSVSSWTLPNSATFRLPRLGASLGYARQNISLCADDAFSCTGYRRGSALLVVGVATTTVDSEIESNDQPEIPVLISARTTIAVTHHCGSIVNEENIQMPHHGQVCERGTRRAPLAKRILCDRSCRLPAAVAELVPSESNNALQ